MLPNTPVCFFSFCCYKILVSQAFQWVVVSLSTLPRSQPGYQQRPQTANGMISESDSTTPPSTTYPSILRRFRYCSDTASFRPFVDVSTSSHCSHNSFRRLARSVRCITSQFMILFLVLSPIHFVISPYSRPLAASPQSACSLESISLFTAPSSNLRVCVLPSRLFSRF